MQIWIIYRFRHKLKLFQSQYPQTNDNDLFWESIEAVNQFRLENNQSFVAERLTKNIENALIRIYAKPSLTHYPCIIPIEDISSSEEPSSPPQQPEDFDFSAEERLISLMNNLGISENVQFILMKQLEGISLQQIARMMGEKI